MRGITHPEVGERRSVNANESLISNNTCRRNVTSDINENYLLQFRTFSPRCLIAVNNLLPRDRGLKLVLEARQFGRQRASLSLDPRRKPVEQPPQRASGETGLSNLFTRSHDNECLAHQSLTVELHRGRRFSLA